MIFTKRARNLRRSQPFHEYVSRRPENDFIFSGSETLEGGEETISLEHSAQLELIKIPLVEYCSSLRTDGTREVKSEGEECCSATNRVEHCNTLEPSVLSCLPAIARSLEPE